MIFAKLQVTKVTHLSHILTEDIILKLAYINGKGRCDNDPDTK